MRAIRIIPDDYCEYIAFTYVDIVTLEQGN